MRHERTFELGVPVSIAHRQWRRFGESTETGGGGQVRFEPLGDRRTRVRLALEQEPERVEKTVEDFISFVERNAEEEGGGEPRDSQGDVPPKKRAR